ncbi:MAG: glycogen debranching protein GlgX [Chloroflexota bacterium]
MRIGKPLPQGATVTPTGINFSIYSSNATSCTLVLFNRREKEPFVEIPFPEEFRIGHIFAMKVFDLDPEIIEYGFRMSGPFQPRLGHRFNPSNILLDPYARVISGRDVWGVEPDPDNPYQHRARISNDDFDWGDDRPPNIAIEDLIIYEMHVRGFTHDDSSGTKHPGTYAAIREKIPYLKQLGVNAVELMPIFEFDEFEYDRMNPVTGERIWNYWGYSTLGFFAPKAGYAATGKLGMQVDELKATIRELHRHDIEVILDVVYNHTAEGDERGHTISFRGLDNNVYYMLTPDGHYYNFSGTGNTMNCNHPVVRSMVIDSLRYWVSEYHIDGFRFDLASILGRDQNGVPLQNPPLLESLASDPLLADVKLIAEAWDAGGLYQVGSFPSYGRWAEWNGKYRDVIRRWVRGDGGIAGEVATRMVGSPDLYSGRGPGASINFITAHDGFTLRDLYSYNEKHNIANSEDNRDGSNDNSSWNCGAEGETDNPVINELRSILMKNAIALLMVSHGTPLLLMGDEMGRTKHGNNNTYCHDNYLTWLDWNDLDRNATIFNFVSKCIAFRKAHPVLRPREHFCGQDRIGSGYPDVSWHGLNAWQPDWSDYSRTLAFMLDGAHASDGMATDDMIYVAMNTHWEPHEFELPHLSNRRRWYRFVDTGASSPEDITDVGHERFLKFQSHYTLQPRTVVILVGR